MTTATLQFRAIKNGPNGASAWEADAPDGFWFVWRTESGQFALRFEHRTDADLDREFGQYLTPDLAMVNAG